MKFVKPSVELRDMTPEDDFLTICIVCSKNTAYELSAFNCFKFTEERVTDGDTLVCVVPSWIEDITDNEEFHIEDIEPAKIVETLLNKKHSDKAMMLASNHLCSENVYNEMIKQGYTPEQAEETLPGGVAIKRIMSGTVNDWLVLTDLIEGFSTETQVLIDMIWQKMNEAGFTKDIEECITPEQ